MPAGTKSRIDMAIAGFHGHDIGRVMEPRLAKRLTRGNGQRWRGTSVGPHSRRGNGHAKMLGRFHLVTGRIWLITATLSSSHLFTFGTNGHCVVEWCGWTVFADNSYP